MEKTNTINQIFSDSTFQHIRKNHALEHATITILTQKNPHTACMGYSFWRGFYIVGNMDIQAVQESVDVAFARLQNGEKSLAIHPSCGTNIAVTGAITGLGALLMLSGTKTERERIRRWGDLALVTGFLAHLSQPLGLKAQEKLTTDPDMRDVKIIGIDTGTIFNISWFCVKTHFHPGLQNQ